MSKEILKVINDLAESTGAAGELRIEAGDEYVLLEMTRADYCLTDVYHYMDQEETLMVVVALLDALQEAWPMYGELEDIMNSLMEDIEDEIDYEDE